MAYALRVVRLKSILLECLRVHYECVRFDRVFDICHSSAGWGASRRVTTLFSFEAAGQRALGLSVDGEVQLRTGEDYVAALAREGDWQSLVALYDVANRRYHGPDAVHGAFLFAGLIPLYLGAIGCTPEALGSHKRLLSGSDRTTARSVLPSPS